MMPLEIPAVQTVRNNIVNLVATENIFVSGVLVEKDQAFSCTEEVGITLINYKRAVSYVPTVDPVAPPVTQKGGGANAG
jgi:hypothetical protein